MKTLRKKSRLYHILLWSALLASLGLLWRLNAILVKPEYIPVDDYVRYWAAGRLVAGGQNPFDPAKVYQMQVSAGAQGMDETIVPLVFNPPWVIPILLPFGLLDYPLSRLLWLLGSVGVLMICAELAWKVYGGAAERRWIAWLVVFSFGPSISVLEKGQITPLILLGTVGFLYYLSRHQYLLAGCCIALISIKPQIFYLFWPALALSFFLPGELRLKQEPSTAWRLLTGMTGAIFSGSLLAMAIHPPIFVDFYHTLIHAPPSNWATPTFGSYLRLFIFGVEAFWTQFLPVLFGLAWLALYAWRHRQDWDWTEAMPWLTLVSLTLAAYAWTYDQVLLVIPTVQVAAWFSKRKASSAAWMLAALFTAINLLDLFLHRELDEFWFLWLAPAYLMCYLFFWHSQKSALLSLT